MGRAARIVVPGMPHHVTQRGNRNAPIFSDDASRIVYISLLVKYAARYGAAIWAYCLMTNHVHHVLVPEADDSLALTMREINTAYANWFNKRYCSPGHLWQARYFSCVMDEPHLWAAVRYVERNPVRAGLVERAEEYPWSSAAAHCGMRIDPLLFAGFPPGGVIADWSKWLADEDVAESAVLRKRTMTGLPAGSASFVKRLEKILGRTLRHTKPGPKRSPTTIR